MANLASYRLKKRAIKLSVVKKQQKIKVANFIQRDSYATQAFGIFLLHFARKSNRHAIDKNALVHNMLIMLIG